ncbi:MAG: GTP-binding protein, partial [Candidatus Omnitrophota bacterium]
MIKTPKSLRLQIGIFGRTNVGKSSFLNMIAGQDVAITSPVAGTTTDVVEKSMELLPIGPVVFLDTAGLDDKSELSLARLGKTSKIFDRADVAVLITEPDAWSEYEDGVMAELKKRGVPVIIAVNKTDLKKPREDFAKDKSSMVMRCSSIDPAGRDKYVAELKRHLIEACPGDFLDPPALIGDLLPGPGGIAALIVPIDLQAPKGRLILPQVQTIRDALDNDASAIVVKEREFASVLGKMKVLPDIVICDSQVVLKMVAD